LKSTFEKRFEKHRQKNTQDVRSNSNRKPPLILRRLPRRFLPIMPQRFADAFPREIPNLLATETRDLNDVGPLS
jgi:hypothetical protein